MMEIAAITSGTNARSWRRRSQDPSAPRREHRLDEHAVAFCGLTFGERLDR